MKTSRQIFLITLLIGACLLMGGCSPAKKPAETMPGTPKEVATLVETEAGKVSGVDQATALVADKNIYIGLDLKANLDKQQSTAIEKSIMDRMVYLEPNYNISVTSDMDTVTMIKAVARGFAQGKPLSDFKNEIEIINTRVTSQKG